MDRRLQRRAGRGRGARRLKGKNATIQMVISDAPQEGEIRFWLRIEDGGPLAQVQTALAGIDTEY